MATFDVPIDPTPGIIDTLIERLENRPALAGVPIFDAEVSPQNHTELVMILGGTDEPEWMSNGLHWKDHNMVIKGVIIVYRPGNTREVIRECRTRAYEILRELELELRGSDAGAVLQGVDGVARARLATVGRRELDQGDTGTLRWASIMFDLDVVKRTARS